MGIHHVVGDLYHKYVYRHIARGTSKMVDSVDYAFSDVFLGPLLFAPEIFVVMCGLMGLGIYQSIERGEQLNISERYWSIPVGLGAIVATAAITYGFNLIRTPTEKKLSLDLPYNINKEEEIIYTIKKLNDLATSPILCFNLINDKVNESLDSLVERIEGYDVRHSKKTKKSIFSKPLFRRGIGGLTNIFFQEIVVTSEIFPQTIAHEKAHLVGYARESEAEFIGYLAMLQSKDPSLEYLAYFLRLRLLRSEFGISIKDLESSGLNQRSLSEIRREENYMDEELAKNSRYTEFMIDNRRKMRDYALRILGQGKLKTKNKKIESVMDNGLGEKSIPTVMEIAYIKKPLRMIVAYDPPK